MKHFVIKIWNRLWKNQKKYSFSQFHPKMKQLFIQRTIFLFICVICMLSGSLALKSFHLLLIGIIPVLFFAAYLLYLYYMAATDGICNIAAEVIAIEKHTNFLNRNTITSLDITFLSYPNDGSSREVFLLKIPPIQILRYKKDRWYELFVSEKSIMPISEENYRIAGIISAFPLPPSFHSSDM